MHLPLPQVVTFLIHHDQYAKGSNSTWCIHANQSTRVDNMIKLISFITAIYNDWEPNTDDIHAKP